MGLRLLVNDFKNSLPVKGTVDHERLDTLQDVHSSCVAALDILNDLLCFNKLESGLLELHQESVGIFGFIKESVAMFNVQARDCGVTLRVLFERPISDEYEGDNDDSSSLASRLNRMRGSVGAVVSNSRGSGEPNGHRNSVNTNNRSRRIHSGQQRRAGNSSSGIMDDIDAINHLDMISLDKFKMDQVVDCFSCNTISCQLVFLSPSFHFVNLSVFVALDYLSTFLYVSFFSVF